MTVVEKRCVLKKLLLIAFLRRRIPGWQQNTGKGFGSEDFLKKEIKNENLSEVKLVNIVDWHIVICRTDNVFTVVKLSNSISHQHRRKSSSTFVRTN